MQASPGPACERAARFGEVGAANANCHGRESGIRGEIKRAQIIDNSRGRYSRFQHVGGMDMHVTVQTVG